MSKASVGSAELNISLLPIDHTPYTEKHTPQPFSATRWRWLALILMNCFLLGDYVVIDSPQALETQIEAIFGLNTQQYSYLYSSWALPSIFIPFIGGYLTDYLGVRPTLFLSCIILTIGQLIYYLGAQGLSFGWMLAGRAVYAVGSNPLNVAQIVIIYKWFIGKEVAFAMAVSSMTACVGRALNSFVVPKIYEMTQELGAPILFGLLVCVFSTIMVLIMIVWDKANDARQQALNPTAEEEEIESPEKISLKDIKHFKLVVWLLVLNFGLTDGYFFSFNAFANDLYHLRYDFSNSAAGNIISINYLLGAISCMIFGVIVDKKGYRASILLYSSFLGVLGFLYFFIFPECSQCLSTMIPQILFGLLIGINDATVFPSLPLVLEDKYLGTGYGLYFVVQNLMILVLPPIAAFINDATSDVENRFFWMLMFFFGLACLTAVESLVLFIQDKRKLGRILDTFIGKEEEYNAGIEDEQGQEENEKFEEEEGLSKEKRRAPLSERATFVSTTVEL